MTDAWSQKSCALAWVVFGCVSGQGGVGHTTVTGSGVGVVSTVVKFEAKELLDAGVDVRLACASETRVAKRLKLVEFAVSTWTGGGEVAFVIFCIAIFGRAELFIAINVGIDKNLEVVLGVMLIASARLLLDAVVLGTIFAP